MDWIICASIYMYMGLEEGVIYGIHKDACVHGRGGDMNIIGREKQSRKTL